MTEKKVIVLGAKGMLGTTLVKFLKAKSGFKIYTHSQTSSADFQSDLTDYEGVEQLFRNEKFDFCINALALTDVNKAESDLELARQLNVKPVQNIVSAVLKNNLDLKLIQISTDHVYNKRNSKESDIKILNQYALTKYGADEIATEMDSVVLRTNFFGASEVEKRSFSDWILESLAQKKKLTGFSDVYFNPLHIQTLCLAIFRVLGDFKKGVFNLGSKKGMSKFEFMLRLARHKKLSEDLIEGISYADSEIAVPRPTEMMMDVGLFESTYMFELPSLEDEIKRC